MTEASLIKFMCRYTLTSLNIIRIIRLLQLFYILLQLTDRTRKFPTKMENTYNVNTNSFLDRTIQNELAYHRS